MPGESYKNAAMIMAVLAVAVIIIATYFAKSGEKSGFQKKYLKKRAVDARQRGKAHYIGGPAREWVEYQIVAGKSEKPLLEAKARARAMKSDHFMSDAYHWPAAGSFGNLADTNPYGNYAGHADMWFPVYNDMANWSWGRGGYGSGRNKE